MILNRPKIVKLPSYLSASSLKMIENMPSTFFIDRLSGEERLPEEQGLPASVGSAFDYFIKIYLAQKMEWHGTVGGKLENMRNTLYKGMYSETERGRFYGKSVSEILWALNVTNPENKMEAAGAGKLIFEAYKKTPMSKPDAYVDIEIHSKYTLKHNGTEVPMFGKGDAIVKAPGGIAPKDWKCSYGIVSPTKGYKTVWRNGVNSSPHKDYKKDTPMELINPDWATQLCIYNWMMGNQIGNVSYGYIDQAFFKNNEVCIAEYEGVITPDFQHRVADRIVSAWNSLRDGSFLRRLAPDHDLVYVDKMNERWW